MEKVEGLKIMTPLHTFLAGASARCTAAIIMFPVDLIKTRLQFQRESNKMIKTVYKNGFDAFRTILKQEGFLSLYKGKTPFHSFKRFTHSFDLCKFKKMLNLDYTCCG
jgi:hypothetical protein